MAPASIKEFLNIQANYRLWIHSETNTLHDNNIQPEPFVLLYIFKIKDFLLAALSS